MIRYDSTTQLISALDVIRVLKKKSAKEASLYFKTIRTPGIYCGKINGRGPLTPLLSLSDTIQLVTRMESYRGEHATDLMDILEHLKSWNHRAAIEYLERTSSNSVAEVWQPQPSADILQSSPCTPESCNFGEPGWYFEVPPPVEMQTESPEEICPCFEEDSPDYGDAPPTVDSPWYWDEEETEDRESPAIWEAARDIPADANCWGQSVYEPWQPKVSPVSMGSIIRNRLVDLTCESMMAPLVATRRTAIHNYLRSQYSYEYPSFEYDEAPPSFEWICAKLQMITDWSGLVH